MKFNSAKKGIHQILNHESAPAYRLSPEWDLYTTVVTSSLSNQFYETSEERVNKLRRLIRENDPLFTARLAIYAREKMNLRSIPLVLAVELAKVHSGDSLVSRLASRIIQRADEITELLAYYQLANERKERKKLNKLSKQLQTGLQHAFNQFDEYQFAKYNRDADIKLRDALFIVHPKAKDNEQQLLFNKITENNLQVPYTWETELSILGQNTFETEQAKKEAFRNKWEELIDSGQLGYMALLRNLRNILDAEVSVDHIEKIGNIISSDEAVLRSRQLPVRFLAAFREISKNKSGFAGKIMDSLEKAVHITAQNITGFEEDTRVLVACDVSGSMQLPVSPKSKILNYDIGLMLGMLLKSRCKNVISGMFGDKWKIINLPSQGILANVDALYKRANEVGYSTNGYLVVQDLIDRNKIIDKIMLFTDCQLWDSRNNGNTQIKDIWRKYKKIAPKAKLYLFDLNGYGKVPLDITGEDVYLIAGWSEKVFDILAAIDNGNNALKEIRNIEI